MANDTVNGSVLEKAKSISAIFAATVLPLLIAWFGHLYSDTNNSREVALKYVELAVSILKESPSEDNKAIREWAVALINEHSKTKMSSDARMELKATPIISYQGNDNFLNMRWESFRAVLLSVTGLSLLEVEKIVNVERGRLKDQPLDKQIQEIQKLELKYVQMPNNNTNVIPENEKK